ncbi:helix-turn-helix domain-containing protein [Streptomyces sp. NPDC057539]|uniref:helix-turn-helix domain-containing protein n=1 Tax=Streptomyces sp. NPDC057539 TaxID=3346159 RepID=UPI0036C73860
MKRQVSYQWRLREKMAAAGMFTTSELTAPLAERGINLSLSQVHRLVTGTPERLSRPCRCWPRPATSSSAPRPA